MLSPQILRVFSVFDFAPFIGDFLFGNWLEGSGFRAAAFDERPLTTLILRKMGVACGHGLANDAQRFPAAYPRSSKRRGALMSAPVKLQEFFVDPARLASGRWCHTRDRQIGEGDINASYSADKIAEGRVRSPFKWQNASGSTSAELP